MKTIQKIFVTMLLAAVPLLLSAQEKENAIDTVTFKTSIECSNCVDKVMSNLPFEKGIRDVQCDIGTQEVTVAYRKKKNDPENIRKAIEKLGYTVNQVTEEQDAKKKDKP